MILYYCAGKKGICEHDYYNCTECNHWDGNGGEYMCIDGHPLCIRSRLFRLRLKYFFKNIISRIHKRKD